MEKTVKTMEAFLREGIPYSKGLYSGTVPIPQIKKDWVLVRNIATGICGSDLHYLSGGLCHHIVDENLPAVIGHENAGFVVEIGDCVEEFAVGDWVVGEPLHPCLTQGLNLCPNCEAGQYHLCDHLGYVGIPVRLKLTGGFGEYSIYYKNTLFHIPEHVSFEESSILDVTACALHAVHISKATRAGKSSCSFGSGHN